jgi:ABC-type Fe3+/spermidine/putrescine transport system ATPase subunit
MRAEGAAVLHATHDVDEALAVADRVVLLRAGEVVQVGAPVEVYERPVDPWAATLTGPASFIAPEGHDAHADHGEAEQVAAGRQPLAASRQPLAAGAGPGADDPSPLDLVRPDWVRFDGPIAATVEDVRYRGTHTDYRLATALGSILLREPGPPRFSAGARTDCRVERRWRVAGPRR